MRKLTVGLLVLFTFSAASLADETRTNVIFLVGDGMGVSYTTAYRLYQDDPATTEVDRTIFDDMLVGMASTYADDHSLVTDSAAAATALACGVKTFNGAIGVDSQHNPVDSMLDKAKRLDYLTGIAVTSQVNHATPAAFVAHADSRQSYDKIADQYLDLRINEKPKVDLILGGGQAHFIRKDRNLIKEFRALGYSYESNIKNLSRIKQLPAIGLFSKLGMEPALESSNPLRLSEMTEKSLDLFHNAAKKNPDGKPFFLLLEASQIDWCGHANDIACAMGEMHDMAITMIIIKRFIDKNPNTIFVATADHSTGGLSLGAKGQYQWNASNVKSISATGPDIARQLMANKSNWRTVWQTLTHIKLADDEQKTLDAFINQADENASDINVSQVGTQVLAYIDKYTATGWTTKGHTGEDVQIFSYGKGKQNFSGAMDNTDIAKKLMNYLNP
ncbi:MAG: alkaline phosphatase [Gammaproteobacteria bacterium]|nr:MAG: alkaline phosphatase [Gammaproteobacteria bacterium]